MKIYETFISIVIAVSLFSISSALRGQNDRRPCRSNNDCPYHDACYNKRCIDVCQLHDGNVVEKKCGDNAFCFSTSEHVATCLCYTGYIGDPNRGCRKDPEPQKSCSTDEDCSHHELCYEKECIDICQYFNGTKVDNKCGENAYCIDVKPHTAECICYSFYDGNPYSKCLEHPVARLACDTNAECSVSEACHEGKCIDICRLHEGTVTNWKCGRNAYCYFEKKHAASCKCLPKHSGDPYTGCMKDTGGKNVCNNDADCPHHAACYENDCVDACKIQNGKVVDSKCGINAFCHIKQSHVAVCKCNSFYNGDPYTECHEIEDDIIPCRTNNDCKSNEACYVGHCIDACKLHNGTEVDQKCGRNSVCTVTSDHSAFCACYSGYIDGPDGGCIKDPKFSQKSCDTDEDCQSLELCYEQKCVDVCQYYDGYLVDKKCGFNATCVETGPHKASCRCYSFHYGNPYSHCEEQDGIRRLCKSDADCPEHTTCFDDECIDVCKIHNGNVMVSKCGRNAHCYHSQPHVGTCECLPKHTGDPYTACQKTGERGVVCRNNADCPYYATCFEKECTDICRIHDGKLVDHKCGMNAYCYDKSPHVADCACYKDHSGDPYSACTKNP